MAVPRRKHSKSRKNKRRSVWAKIERPNLVACPQCHELRLPHRVCLKCGYYKGKEVTD